MFVGALLDAGAPFDLVRNAVAALPLSGVEVRAEKVRSHGIAATSFSVIDSASGKAVDDVEGTCHRHPSDLYAMIDGAGLPERIKGHARAVISLLAGAEAKVHGIGVEEVHFHEIGAVDTIVDAVAAAAAFEGLSIGYGVAAPVSVGGGAVKTMHGRLPVPAPATLELLKGFSVSHGSIDMELTTPTGAALLAHFASSFGPIPDMTVETAGYGAGRRDTGSPNVFRAVLGSR